MKTITVTTKEELEKAKILKYEEIFIVGEVANKLVKSKKIAKLGKIGLAVLSASLASIPFTGGSSAAIGFAAVSATTGLSVVAIGSAVCLGISLVVGLLKDYDVTFEASIGTVKAKVILKRKEK